MRPIEVRGLRKRYGAHTAVDGIDLAVEPGEVFALLGPNGAGKTTTVEILEGHRRRDGGEVRVLGEDPGGAGRRWRARIGVVLQTANDAAELTVSESVRHYAGYYPDRRDPEELIAAVGLAGKAGARVRTLSGGQRRRLDVALGIVGRPELVFLDEPTTGFDPEARRQFWDLIRALAADGTTILLTTHYLDEAEALAGRLAVLAGGRIVAEGTPHTVGGRDRAPAAVSWRDAEGFHEVHTDEPDAVVARLSGFSDLRVTRPSLEDVYLALIGEGR
ncbi:ABC transporter ATP-binding protein [Dactylosporangium matsuzakiense]|uniref:ABC transporter n=1 Tax=Dactylosporangium matsuzakiense TaxID=53360 RepID=A0A9W6NMW6_9ACTN|nr:ABC transporter ATP-binding protein [Dactylosporangium matsuzakiense]UWZ43299.1 ABC transporter ATP-binding protein [Dactylosporangium matsuzakiense]GLL02593.1 ABC transporter [Dactylosporangium matsuzakiense]